MEKNDKAAMGETSSAKTADECQQLQEENSRLRALLKQHGTSWEDEPVEEPRLQLPNDQAKFARMWDKRERGYRAMRYKVCSQ